MIIYSVFLPTFQYKQCGVHERSTDIIFNKAIALQECYSTDTRISLTYTHLTAFYFNIV